MGEDEQLEVGQLFKTKNGGYYSLVKYNGQYAIYLLNNRSWKDLLDFNEEQILSGMWYLTKEEAIKKSFHPNYGDKVVSWNELLNYSSLISPEKVKKAYRPGNIIFNNDRGYVIIKFPEHTYKMVPLSSLHKDLSNISAHSYSSKKELRESLNNGYDLDDKLVKLDKF